LRGSTDGEENRKADEGETNIGTPTSPAVHLSRFSGSWGVQGESNLTQQPRKARDRGGKRRKKNTWPGDPSAKFEKKDNMKTHSLDSGRKKK